MSQLRQMAEDGPPTFTVGGADGAPYEIRATPATTPDGSAYLEPLDAVEYTGDIADPPVVAAPVAWARVMRDVKSIDKKSIADIKGRDGAPGYKFNFRGIDKVLNAVGPALRRHGVAVLPHRVEAEHNGAGRMRECTVTVTYRIYGPGGDFMETQGAGEGLDGGERATPKALTTAYRNMLIVALCIPTEDPKLDPDVTNVQREEPRPPSPVEYRDEILNPRTGKTRMLQIRRELTVRGGHGAAMVADERDTGEVTLIELCERVGRERFAPGGGS